MRFGHVFIYALVGLVAQQSALAFVLSPKISTQSKYPVTVSPQSKQFNSLELGSMRTHNARQVIARRTISSLRTRLFMSTKAADFNKAVGKKRLATAMAFLAGWANIAIFLRFKTFATMMSGNTMWMAVALTERKFSTVAYYLAVMSSYLLGTGLFRRIDLSLRKKTLPVCSAIVASLFLAGDWIHYSTYGAMPNIAKWIPMMMFAGGFGMINALGTEVTGTLNFVVTGHYSKLVNVVVDRFSRTAGRKRLTDPERNVATQNAAVSGGFFVGALFASLLLGWNCLHRFGIFSAIGLSHAVLWVVRDIEALGGAWWLRKDGAMCDIDDDGEICDLPDEDEVVNGSKVAGVDENVVTASSN